MPPYRKKPARMSLAAALEEERLELAGELEARTAASRRNPGATTTRSLLDIAPSPESPEALPPRHGSIAGIGVGVTPPFPRRSWHDPAPAAPSLRVNTAVAPPPAPATAASQPTSTSPDKEFGPNAAATTTRRFSDNAALEKKKLSDAKGDHPDNKTSNSAATSPVASKPKPSIRWDDSVVMSPSTTTYSLNRRANRSSDKSNKPPQSKNAMAAVMSGLDLKVGLPSFTRGRDSSRNNNARGTSLDSRLSTSRLGRSSSPRNRWLGSSSRNASSNPGKPAPEKPAPEKPKPVEIENADKPQATPAPVPAPAPTHRRETSDPDRKPSTSGDERLAKDMYDSENNPIETSDEEADDSSSSDDDDSTSERGRKPTVNIILPDRSISTASAKTGPPPLPVEQKENAEEKSDYSHSSKQGPIPKKPDVHPRTSFDSGASMPNTPFGSDDEAELCDIKRAQQLGIELSAIDSSVQNRSIRTIIRGDYAQQSSELEGGRRRQRKYLVATDLSEESVYALEWTIGTILRDGDTMFAVCAIHDETAASNSLQVGDNAKAMQDAAAVIGSQTEETAQKPHNDSSTNLSRAILGRLGTDSKPSSVDARGMPKIESERVRSVEVISQTCVRLLRKTLLQVRVAVEAIHCKSPKHMITEAIDGLDPTLVIVGARGRSALKGVLLGSFSNYLVMHSSVPVMVARKKLKKHSKNKKGTSIRLSNNLATPKKLAFAKVD
ncbi:universal stress protein family domain protein [Aspergillus affinis]|uniref:universal stress protein family domain protein n=1 Tax=Aspergillus affinis TaxID=1070780 RepID=UPI0022FE3E37|nr:uncharacterized protein KD926_001912 [Aspergillus affinis]KAI9044089.1 hypothetical protein KD926_001912 [Aspergillus affinis]